MTQWDVYMTDEELSELSQDIKLSVIRNSLPELEAAYNINIKSAEHFSALVNRVALKAGVSAAVLAIYITAVCQHGLSNKQRQTNQLSVLFDKLGG